VGDGDDQLLAGDALALVQIVAGLGCDGAIREDVGDAFKLVAIGLFEALTGGLDGVVDVEDLSETLIKQRRGPSRRDSGRSAHPRSPGSSLDNDEWLATRCLFNELRKVGLGFVNVDGTDLHSPDKPN
jgi:hypothetical protein